MDLLGPLYSPARQAQARRTVLQGNSMKMHLKVLLTLLAVGTLCGSAFAEGAGAKSAGQTNLSTEATAQKASSVSGRVIIQGTNITIKNSRNAYAAQGKSLDEFKKFENTDVRVKGYVSEGPDGKQILVTSIKGQPAPTAANNLVAKLNK